MAALTVAFGSTASAQQVEELVVTAERREMQLQDTPISIIALSGATVEAKGIEQISDLTLFTPNLAIQGGRFSGNNTPTYSIRGISGGGGTSGERGVAMYVDGIYMPRTTGSLMRVFDVDRIEVLRGPQGTLFGRNSTGGAIRVFTKQPGRDFDAYVRATLGNFDRHDVTAMVNMPIGDNFAVRVQAGWLNQDGYVKRGPEKLGGSKDKVIRIQGKWDPLDNFSAVLGLSYSRNRGGGNPQVLRTFDMRPGIEGVIQGNFGDWLNDAFKLQGQAPLEPYNDPRVVLGKDYETVGFCFLDDFNPDYDPICKQYDNTDYLQADLKLTWNLNDKTSITTTGGYGSLVHTGRTDSHMIAFSFGGDDVKSKTLFQEVQLNTSLFNDRLDFVMGGNYFSEHSSSGGLGTVTRRGTSTFTPQAANGNADAGLFITGIGFSRNKSESFGVFGSGTLHITDKLNLTGGLRYGYDKKWLDQTSVRSTNFTPAPGTDLTNVTSDHSWTALDWRVTADYHFTDDKMVYATASKAYKAGAFSFTIAQNVPGPAQSGDFIQPINPEKVVNYELGARTTWFDNRLRINPTIYYMQWTNRQAAVNTPCPTDPTCPVTGFRILLTDTGGIDLSGLELDGQLAVTRDFSVDFSLGLTEYNLKNPTANGGPNLYPSQASPSFNIGGTYNIPLSETRGDVSFNINYAYIGGQSTHPEECCDSAFYLRSYDVLNGRVTWRSSDRKISASLFANNLANNHYATYGTSAGGGFWDAGGPPSATNGLQSPLRRAVGLTMARPREFGITLQYNF